MRLDRTFLLLNLILILVSVAAQEIAAGNFLFLAITAAVCWSVWYLDGKGGAPRIGDMLATLICIVAFVVIFHDAITSSATTRMHVLDIRVPAVVRFLIIFQWITLFRKKRTRDYAWIYVVSLVHMGTAGLLMPGVAYGLFFFLYALAGVSVLAVYHLWLEARAADEETTRATQGVPYASRRVGFIYLTAAVPATLLLLLPIAGAFVALPRRPAPLIIARRIVGIQAQPITGFSPTTRLGDIGTIQENPRRVMHLTLKDPDTGKTIPADNLLLRGLALDTYVYDDGLWIWDSSTPSHKRWRLGRGDIDTSRIHARTFPDFHTSGHRRIQCEITLEPLAFKYLFVPFAAESISLPKGFSLRGYAWTHSYRYDTSDRRPFTYTVTSRIFTPGSPVEPATGGRSRDPDLQAYLQLPEEIAPRVHELAEQIAPDDGFPTDADKAARVAEYLSDAEVFSYTLNMQATPEIEPVEDFLFNRRSGHCEYFASAMVILLRSRGVAARLVNGFKVDEWNPISGHYVVRQSHAHSWVEVYLRPGGWRTYDPSALRDDATPEPLFVRRWWRNLYDHAETLWVRHVLSFDAERQHGIYAGVAAVLRRVRDALSELWTAAFILAGAKLHALTRQHLRALLRWLGPAARPLFIIVMALILAALGRSIFQRLRTMPARHRRALALKAYRRMERLLARRGFHRGLAQTPWEFHQALAAHGWPALEPVAALTATFCAVRYGNRRLSPEDVREAAQALRDLRRARHRRPNPRRRA